MSFCPSYCNIQGGHDFVSSNGTSLLPVPEHILISESQIHINIGKIFTGSNAVDEVLSQFGHFVGGCS